MFTPRDVLPFGGIERVPVGKMLSDLERSLPDWHINARVRTDRNDGRFDTVRELRSEADIRALTEAPTWAP